MITKEKKEPKIEEGGESKICPGCNEEKDVDRDFGYRLMKSVSKSGVVKEQIYKQSHCKKCRSSKAVKTAATVPVNRPLTEEEQEFADKVFNPPADAEYTYTSNGQFTITMPSVVDVNLHVKTMQIKGSPKHKPDQVEEFRTGDIPKPEAWMSPWDKEAVEAISAELRRELVDFIDRLNKTKEKDDASLMDEINDWLNALTEGGLKRLRDYMTATDPGTPENGWFNYGYNQMDGFLEDVQADFEHAEQVKPISSREDLTALYRVYFPDDKGNNANTFRPVKFMADKLIKKFERENVNAELVKSIQEFISQ